MSKKKYSTVPIDIVEEIMSTYKLNRFVNIDVHYNVVFWFDNLYLVTKKSLERDCEGVAQTYNEACIDFIQKLLDKKYNIRINGGYHTDDVRNIIENHNFKEYMDTDKE